MSFLDFSIKRGSIKKVKASHFYQIKTIKTMSLSKESIKEFKGIFKKEYGKELSNQEAYP